LLDTVIVYVFLGLILVLPLSFYIVRQVRREKLVREAVAKGQLYSEGPRGQHPHIDVTNCIGCQACTAVCPEGDVLGMVGGKAAFLKPYKCIGHGLCVDVCPVGAIHLVTASPSMSADLPYLSAELETTVENLFMAGELTGLALIKNAVRQGQECIDRIADRLAESDREPLAGVVDVIIVGAGPAGISATLRAIELRLTYVTLEREELGGSVSKYPRQKVVMTSPIEFPLGVRLKKMQLSKERLLEFWSSVCARDDFRVQLSEPVETIQKADGIFTVTTNKGSYRSRAVLLAMGINGVPKKLGVKGEELPKVMYRLIEADHYTHNHILVVGGGDSAVEAAMGLSMQKGNTVTLSYRKGSFSRIKERNAQKIAELDRAGKLKVIFNSMPVEFTPTSVKLDAGGEIVELPNDFVWVFAGGIAPHEFLKKVGIGFGSRDLTVEAAREAGDALQVQ